MASTIEVLSYSSLSTAVDERKAPNRFLSRLLFSSVETLHTETVELSIITRGRKIAPFVRKNGSALLHGSYGKTFMTIDAPNIRLKRPFTPSELLFDRQPGNVIFASEDDQASALEMHVARDIACMDDDIVNAEEWMASQIIGPAVIAYEVADEEVFSVTRPKPAGNTITLAGDDVWNNADPTLPQPYRDFHLVKRVLSQEVALAPTDAIMGEDAAESFMRLNATQQFMDQRNLTPGMVDFTTQFSEDGAIFLGTFCGVRCWEYSRSASLNGTDTPMIRANFVEFVCATPAAQNVLYYGAIPDMKTLRGRMWKGRRFSKSWEVEDPSAMMALEHSRPLPWMKRAGSSVSMQVQAAAA